MAATRPPGPNPAQGRKSRTRRVLALAALVPLSLAAACGGGGGQSSEGPVEVEFWGWAPGYEKAVKTFNAAHDQITVTFETTPSGAEGGYKRMLNAVQAGNAPCLAQVGYETLPSFAVQGALMDVAEYADKYADEFVKWTWRQSSVGEHVFAIPVDTGPMALFYRKDVFAKFGIEVPQTWQDYAAAAQRLHRADSDYYMGSFPSGGVYHMAGLAWQNGAQWFGTKGDSWTVNIDGAKTKKVAAYWQDLIDRGLVKSMPWYEQGWFQHLQKGTIATVPAAVWMAPIIAKNAPKAAGKWAVAPLPQWKGGGKSAGNVGGSSTAVLKGCENPEAAVTFAHWMSTADAALKTLINVTGIFPASHAGLEHPLLSKPSEYYGGEVIYDVFAKAAANTNTSWRWGPTMTQVVTAYSDATGKGGLVSAINQTQQATVAAIKRKGLSVSAG